MGVSYFLLPMAVYTVLFTPSFLIDSREAAELLQLFLTGRGFGASPEAARDAVGRVERSGCSIPVLQRELEDLALVM
jgi:hypothetical protein